METISWIAQKSWQISRQIAIFLTVVSLLLSQVITAATIFMLFPPPGSPPGGALRELVMAAKLVEDAPTSMPVPR